MTITVTVAGPADEAAWASDKMEAALRAYGANTARTNATSFAAWNLPSGAAHPGNVPAYHDDPPPPNPAGIDFAKGQEGPGIPYDDPRRAEPQGGGDGGGDAGSAGGDA